jgi:hypothetical protein
MFNIILEATNNMAWLPIVSLIVSCLGIPSLGALVITDIYRKHKENSEQAKELKRKQAMDDVREVVKEEIKPTNDKLEDTKEEIKSLKTDIAEIKTGTLASLRNDLLGCYYDCCKKGYRTSDDIHNWQDMLDAYHKLGGNSFITEVNVLFNELPSEEQWKSKKKFAKSKSKTILVENKNS